MEKALLFYSMNILKKHFNFVFDKNVKKKHTKKNKNGQIHVLA